MVAFAILRQVTRVGPARLVAGMRVSLASSSVSKISKMSMNVGVRAFSGTARRFGDSPTDISLSQKLKEELTYEKESLPEPKPEFVKAFLKEGVWEIHDTPGHDEVTFTRKFGDENIRLIFSIADAYAEEEDMEDLEGDSENEIEDTPQPYPIRVTISVTKSGGPGALNFDLMCQEGSFAIENISFYDDANLGTDLTAEADWKRRGLYIGPQFGTLDFTVQEEFKKYLEERGVSSAMCTFIPEYVAHKEQQEYVKWLSKVNNFVEL